MEINNVSVAWTFYCWIIVDFFLYSVNSYVRHEKKSIRGYEHSQYYGKDKQQAIDLVNRC